MRQPGLSGGGHPGLASGGKHPGLPGGAGGGHPKLVAVAKEAISIVTTHMATKVIMNLFFLIILIPSFLVSH
jgi:hypothetical protein